MYVKSDDMVKYGFLLRHPCGSFEWKPDPSWVTTDDASVGGHGQVADSRCGRRGQRISCRSLSPVWQSCDRAESSPLVPVVTGSGGSKPFRPFEYAVAGAIALLDSDQALGVHPCDEDEEEEGPTDMATVCRMRTRSSSCEAPRYC